MNGSSLDSRGSRAAVRRALMVQLGLLPLLTSVGYAQASNTNAGATSVEEIVITGSRIRGAEPVGSNVVSLGRLDIDASPGATVVDMLRDVPQVINLGADASHRGVQGGQANTRFASGINLRGLGPNATLLLVDGNRMPLSGNLVHFVDPSVIPTIAIERMEVVADGASSIYGSDAIAGVVNFVLRDRYVGAETSVQYSFADDFSKHRIGQLFGYGWDTGNVMLAYESSYNSNLWGGDRSSYTSDQRARGGADYRSSVCNPGTLLVGGVRYALPAGDGTSVDPSALVANTVNRCDDVRNTDLMPRSDRSSFALKATQDLGDRFTLTVDGFYSERDFRIFGYLDSSVANSSLVVPSSNAYFVSPVPTATSVTVSYLFPEEFGLSQNYGKSKSYLGLADLTADLGGDWEASLKASYGESQDLLKSGNFIVTRALNAALASSDPATAFNPFGDGSAMNPAILDRIRGTQIGDIRHRLTTVSLDANGSLFELPGGDVRLAVGVETRDEFYGVDTLRTDGSLTVDRAERSVDSAYAELLVPLVQGLPLANSLVASLSIRHDDYSDFGSTTNPKFGLNWTPVEGLTVKASHGTSYRAPSLVEVNAPVLIYQQTLADPTSGTGQSTGISFGGGNPNLDAEEAETWSFGVDWQPYSIPGLRANLSYFRVTYEGQILDLQGVTGRLADPAYAQYVTRNPSLDQINAVLANNWRGSDVINPAVVRFIVDGRRQNLGVTKADGIDLATSYDWDTTLGTFSVGLTGTYYTRFDVAQSSIVAARDVLNTIDNPLRTRFRARLGWQAGDISAAAYFNRSSGYTNNLVAQPEPVDAWQTVDLNLSYDFPTTREDLLSGVSLGLIVENALDEEPPYVNRIDGFDPQVSSLIGRTVSLAVRKRW